MARRIAEDGHARGIALFPRSTWGDRLSDAFTDGAAGDGRRRLRAAQFYDPGARDFSAPLRAALGRYAGAGDRPAKGAAGHARRRGRSSGRARSSYSLRPRRRRPARYPPAAAIPDGLRPPRLRHLRCLGPGRAFGARPRRPDFPGNALDPARGGLGAPELWQVLHGDWLLRRAQPASPVCVRLRCATSLLRGLNISRDAASPSRDSRAGWSLRRTAGCRANSSGRA